MDDANCINRGSERDVTVRDGDIDKLWRLDKFLLRSTEAIDALLAAMMSVSASPIRSVLSFEIWKSVSALFSNRGEGLRQRQ